jgi:hypothetical protein
MKKSDLENQLKLLLKREKFLKKKIKEIKENIDITRMELEMKG